MDQDRLYRFRSSAVGFTRSQLVVVVIALTVAVAGVIALVLGQALIAAALMGAAGATMGLTTLLAHGNKQPPA